MRLAIADFTVEPTRLSEQGGTENWCMFWCMFAFGITAIYRDILQHRAGALIFHSVEVMRIFALPCCFLQPSKNWTQNPPIFGSWGFAPLPAP
jgi:hypothetical protein